MAQDHAIILILLTQGKVAVIDAKNVGRVSKYKWRAHWSGNNWYAAAVIGDRKTVLMHRFIMSAKPEEEVDHKDRNGLNNLESNMRFCTRTQNSQNSRAKGGSSKYKGVCWKTREQRWIAQIQPDRVNKYLGSFLTEEEAALAYNEAAIKHFGEFAHLNEVIM